MTGIPDIRVLNYSVRVETSTADYDAIHHVQRRSETLGSPFGHHCSIMSCHKALAYDSQLAQFCRTNGVCSWNRDVEGFPSPDGSSLDKPQLSTHWDCKTGAV